VKWWEKPNSGLSDTLNVAVAAASGDYVGWLNSDDFYLPWTLSVLRTALQEHPDADVVYGDSLFVTEHGDVLRLAGQHPFSATSLRGFGPFIHPCAMFVRTTSLPARGFDTGMLKLMDWDLYLQLLQDGASFRYVRAPLGAFRRHERQASVVESAGDRAEYARLYTRFGQSSAGAGWRARRLVGHLDHAARKAVNGSYTRQVAVSRRLRGQDANWMAGDAGRQTMRSLAALYRGLPAGDYAAKPGA
jgi:hypothetical protein